MCCVVSDKEFCPTSLLALYVDDLLMINLDAVVIISTIFYNNYRLCCIMLTTFYHFLHPVMVYRK